MKIRIKGNYTVTLKHVCIIIIIGIVITCLLPIILTQFSVVDFTSTGSIGDTIGGIMGPFVAIIAAYITFLAFLMQYQANEIQKTELKRQASLHDKEQFEAKLYQMLDVYNQNVSRLRAGDLVGKYAFPELLSELHYIYRCVRFAYRDIKNGGILSFVDGREQQRVMNLYMDEVLKDEEDENKELMRFAYSLFFYGFPHITPDTKYKGKYILQNEIFQRMLKISFEESNLSYREYFISEEHNINSFPQKNVAKYKIMTGHNEEMGTYFRQLFQIVKLIATLDASIADEDQKYEYAKLLRSQLTDDEQVLLFYNSMSEMGAAWNEQNPSGSDERERMGLIARFRLIKNIPQNYPYFGANPKLVYQKEEETWRVLYGKEFFEHPIFMQEGRSNYSPKSEQG